MCVCVCVCMYVCIYICVCVCVRASLLLELPPFIGTVEVVGMTTFLENTLLSDFCILCLRSDILSILTLERHLSRKFFPIPYIILQSGS
jgi:hypothetical protein